MRFSFSAHLFEVVLEVIYCTLNSGIGNVHDFS